MNEFIDLKKDPRIKDDRRDIAFYFPINSKIPSISKLNPKNSNNLKLTYEGVYSITRPAQGSQYIEQLSKYHELKNYHLVDGTAGLGGDLIYISSLFKSITAYEFNPIHADAIKSNCSEYNINLTVHIGNFTDEYKKVLNNNTVLWLDPPWGGRSESNKNDLRLNFYGEPRVYVNDFIKSCFKECNIPVCIMKCPSKTYLRDFLPNEYRLTKISVKREHPSSKSTNYELFQLVIIKRVKKNKGRNRLHNRSRSRSRSKSRSPSKK
jgi:predicted RNA methylase